MPSFSNRGCPKNELSRLSIELAEAHEAGSVNWGETPKVWGFSGFVAKNWYWYATLLHFLQSCPELVGKLTGIPDFDRIVTRKKIGKVIYPPSLVFSMFFSIFFLGVLLLGGCNFNQSWENLLRWKPSWGPDQLSGQQELELSKTYLG